MMDGLSIHQFFFWVKKVTPLHYTLPSSSLPPSSLRVAKVKMKQICEVPSRFFGIQGIGLEWFFTLKFLPKICTTSKLIPRSNSCRCILQKLVGLIHHVQLQNIVGYWFGTSNMSMYSLFKRFKKAFQAFQLGIPTTTTFPKGLLNFHGPFGVGGLPKLGWGVVRCQLSVKAQPLGISQPKVSMWSPEKTAAGEEVGSTFSTFLGGGE